MEIEMRTLMLAAPALFALAIAQDDSKAKAEHIVVAPEDVKWGDAPPSLPPGAKLAVIEGDPKKEGYFMMRLKVPAGYKIPPHFHPQPERVTVISGKFCVGFGDTFDETKTKALPAGSYFSFIPKSHHFAHAAEETVLQLSTIGPWDLTYVNPADDPRTKK
jgi:quercetin dioxygenase-like cupin family protein